MAFSHPAPADRSALARAFGTAALEFDAGVNELVFRAEDAHAPLPSGDPRLAELLRGHAGMLLSAAHPSRAGWTSSAPPWTPNSTTGRPPWAPSPADWHRARAPSSAGSANTGPPGARRSTAPATRGPGGCCPRD
ncbi:hypothetical protein [Nocardiopsis changdeensis]|uniref:hypothetical protein n=1 Tax=Nocardiopsis changdeensis TaxID=2831969 RepID=UPI003F46A497